MKVAVLGTGMIGITVVREIAAYKHINQVVAVDGLQENIDKCLKLADNEKVTGRQMNLANAEDILEAIKGMDAAIACLPHFLSMPAIKAAIAAKCHLVDLVGTEFEEKMKLDQQAKKAGITIVPGCGVAPGIINFLAAQGIELLDEADEAIMICGGIPKDPQPPLGYQIVFRLESVLGLYTRPALAAENGELVHLPPLSGMEKMTFPEPVGECEAVVTDAHSTAYTLKDKVKKIYEKTVRYTGHWDKMAVLAELGFLDDKEVEVDGVKVRAKKYTEKILEPQLRGKSIEDITVVRVTVSGKKNGKDTVYAWEMLDFYDHDRGITSMAKTTAIPAMLMTNWILEGRVTETGVVPVENVIIGSRFDDFVSELRGKGIEINQFERVLS
ncbi:L-lysine dehydrogenase [Siminovitchia acidinfaciens]|uniref:L-lysine dehydrogenase n=1 Tax=Siminovitchia acidinfaciens TaxID=2321395 RepID=A0A429XZ96_9BACI|nr:saccharopine dehydrogenase C-terminal domain-containing protein [Siminovitchia acidinfaciens]RST74100.1 L-lysine dehydrogenase [Siminovitchia acidinfaciens]